MGETNLREADRVVAALRSEASRVEGAKENVPGLLLRVLRENLWRERYVKDLRKVVTFERFSDFVTMHPLEGMGTSVDRLAKLCEDDAEALRLLISVDPSAAGLPLEFAKDAAARLGRDDLAALGRWIAEQLTAGAARGGSR